MPTQSPIILPPSSNGLEPRYAVLELVGRDRQQIAGAVSFIWRGREQFASVEVPHVTFTDDAGLQDVPAHTCEVRCTAVFRIDWCTDTQAVEAAHAIRHRPLHITVHDTPPKEGG